MLSRLFAICLCVAGTVICAVAVMFIVLGPQLTGELLTALLIAPFWSRALGGAAPPNLITSDADSELRFYSVFFLAFGLWVIRTGWTYPTWHRHIPIMLAIFFAGGVARALSWVQTGPPAALFQVLCIIELCLPVMLYVLYRASRPKT